MKMDKSLKEVYDGIKKLITISERIEGHTEDIAEIKGEIGAIERRLNLVEGRLDSLDTGQKVISVDIRAIKDKLEVKDEIYAIKA